LYSTQYLVESDKKVKGEWENDNLLRVIYNELFLATGRTQPRIKEIYDIQKGKMSTPVYAASLIGNIALRFTEEKDAEECRAIYERYLMTDHCEIFLEEPENNLFPPTQDSLVKWLLDKTLDEHSNTLFIATHSPYVLTSVLEEKGLPLSLFLVYEKNGRSMVKTASKEEINGIYDYGIDAFFNLNNLVL
jgi:hypothetical protein